jgi:hypothetical protein
MFNYLKFIFVFLFELVKNNPIKLSLIVASIILFSFAGTIPDSHDKYNIVAETKVENTYIYIYKTIGDNKIGYENIWSEGKPIEVKNGVITLVSYHGGNYALWAIFVIIVIILIVAFFIGLGDDDIGWDFEDVWESAFCSLIYCEEENGVFYYFALGRLIEKRNNQISRHYNANRELKIGGFRDLYRCPKYQTKKQKRETLLKNIGIN